MGLFTPYIYKSKSGKQFWLHMKMKGKVRMYYFSKDPVGALNSLPKGFEVVENPRTGMPYLKKKASGGFLAGILKLKTKIEEKSETQEAKPEQSAK